METAGVEGGLVRILKRADDRPAGLGFVVGERQVLTAAHVVNTALGRDRRDGRRPERPPVLTVEFPLLGRSGAASRRARLEAWMPSGERVLDGDDVAGLVLTDGEGLPDGACPLRLEDRRDAGEVRIFGPHPARPQGGYADGRVMGLVSNGRLQIDERVVGVFQVGRGWSGGPVWDRLTGKAVGMLVAAPADESHVDVYAIPTETLVDAWPEALGALLIPPNPYQGLRPFGKRDHARFFGRERFVKELIPQLHRRGMVAVVGPSGSGKSSVVHGGVVPLLEADGWLVMPFRPGPRPTDHHRTGPRSPCGSPWSRCGPNPPCKATKLRVER